MKTYSHIWAIAKPKLYDNDMDRWIVTVNYNKLFGVSPIEFGHKSRMISSESHFPGSKRTPQYE